jgi:hypothetical protein
MDFFIMLSSMAGIFGNVGQSSYCAGNTYQDALARYRTAIGERALSLDLGVITGGGYVADNREVMDRLMMLNLFRPLNLEEVLTLVEYGCSPHLQPTQPFQSQIITGFELPADIEWKGRDVPSAMEQAIFCHMRQANCSFKQKHESTSHVRTFRSIFTEAEFAVAAATIVAEALKMKVSRVLGIPVEQISTGSALDSYGVDSLVGLELRNWLSKESDAELAVFDILGGATLMKIGKMVASKSSLRSRR